MKGKWIRKPQGEASVVFVHGILSSGETCWRNDNGCYWPELLKNEPELGPLGIYVFTYETGNFSGSYGLGDIVDALKTYMGLDGVLASDWLVLVCHSMGGIVVRKFIVSRAAELIGAGKEIDLFLVAFPSLGSSYADWGRVQGGISAPPVTVRVTATVNGLFAAPAEVSVMAPL